LFFKKDCLFLKNKKIKIKKPKNSSKSKKLKKLFVKNKKLKISKRFKFTKKNLMFFLTSRNIRVTNSNVKISKKKRLLALV
jgi:hypothetical protein